MGKGTGGISGFYPSDSRVAFVRLLTLSDIVSVWCCRSF